MEQALFLLEIITNMISFKFPPLSHLLSFLSFDCVGVHICTHKFMFLHQRFICVCVLVCLF